MLPDKACVSDIYIANMICSLMRYYLVHPLITNSMEQSPSWEVIKSSASQEIPSLLGNLKDHYHIHRSPPSVPILRQINPVHAPPSHFLQMNFNIILPSSSEFSKWCPSLKSSHQKPVCTSSPSQYVLHALPIAFFLCDHPSNIWWGVQTSKLLVM